MNEVDYVRDDLKHVRLIHLSLFAVSVVIIYLLFTTWSSYPDVIREIDRLQVVVAELRSAKPMLHRAVENRQLEWIPEYRERLRRLLTKVLNRDPTWAHRVEIRKAVLLGAVQPPLSDAMDYKLLDALRTALETARWPIRRVNRFKLANNEALQNIAVWLDEEPTEIEGYLYQSSIGKAYLKSIEIRPDGEATITFAKSVLTITHRDLRPSGTTTFHERKKTLRLLWEAEDAFFQLPSTWFLENFPLLDRQWNSIRQKSLADALSWTRRERDVLLAEKNLQLLGFKIEGVHLSWIGPIFFICLQVYMLAHLQQVWRRTSHQPDSKVATIAEISPWVGAMATALGRLVSWGTLVFVPPLVSALMLLRQEELGFGWGVAVGGIGVLGLACAFMGELLARRHV